MKLLNNLEGGTSGATISTSNAGGTGNTLFDAVSIGGSGTAVYSSTAAHGTLAAQLANAASTSVYLAWNASLTNQAGSGIGGTLYHRVGVRLAALPGSEVGLLRGLTSGGAQRWRICLDSSGHVLVRNAANTTIATSTTTLTTGTWWRIEAAMAAPNTTAGTAEVRIYAADATTPTETVGPLSAQNFSGPVFEIRFGHAASASSVTTLLLDDLGVSDEGWLGPNVAVPLVRHVWVGAITDTTALVSYGSSGITAGQLVVSTTADLATSPVTGSSVAADTNGNMLLPASGLQPDTQYYGGIKADGTLLATGRCNFRTDPAAGSTVSFSFIFGSCQQTNSNTDAFAAGLAMTGPYGKARRWIHEGDLHYRDFGSSNTLADIVSQYRSSLAPSNVAALVSQLPMPYGWDNHDWGGADSNSATPRAADLKAAYRSFVPAYHLADADQATPTGAIYQTWTLGRVRFIHLDTRSERSDRTLAESGTKNLLGTQQENWLYAQLLQPEPVKIIICGIYWRQDSSTGDRWGSYSTQWTRIKNWSAAHPDVHAYVIAGDRHALAADDGTSPGCYLPQAVGAPFDQGCAASSEAWTGGYYITGDGVNMHSFGWMDVVDAGSSITLNFTGYTSDGTAHVTQSTTFPVVGVTGQWGVPL